jgi:hypothetical protein
MHVKGDDTVEEDVHEERDDHRELPEDEEVRRLGMTPDENTDLDSHVDHESQHHGDMKEEYHPLSVFWYQSAASKIIQNTEGREQSERWR